VTDAFRQGGGGDCSTQTVQEQHEYNFLDQGCFCKYPNKCRYVFLVLDCSTVFRKLEGSLYDSLGHFFNQTKITVWHLNKVISVWWLLITSYVKFGIVMDYKSHLLVFFS
jgi:hypothetical protein